MARLEEFVYDKDGWDPIFAIKYLKGKFKLQGYFFICVGMHVEVRRQLAGTSSVLVLDTGLKLSGLEAGVFTH